MSYFVSADAHDQSLLHSSIRAHADLPVVAAQVEVDVIAYFIEPGDDGSATPAPGELFSFEEHGEWFTVRLMGYHSDPVLASGYDADRAQWTGLARALRQVIADVVSHRLRHYDDRSGVVSWRRSKRSESRSEALDTQWPEDWSRGLARYRRIDYLTAI